MKIAMFHYLGPGGARRASNEYARELIRIGHTVDLFVIDSLEPERDELVYSNIRLYMFKPVVWSGASWKRRLYRDTVELWRLLQLEKHIAQDIDNGEYDVVLVQPSRLTQAPFILKFLKTRNVYYCQETLRIVYDSLFPIPIDLPLFKRAYESLSRALRKWIDRQNLLSAAKILTNSHYTQTQIRNAYGLRSSVCHLGVDPRTFYPSTQKKTLDILFLGTKEVHEGYPLLIDAMQKMKVTPNVKFHIRGEHWVTTDQLRNLYSKAKIVVCLSLHEPFGLVVLEAMACGAVVVALNEGGYKDTIDDGVTGILVKNNADELARNLHRLLGDTHLQKRIIKNARTKIENYWTWKSATQRLLVQLQSSTN